MPKMAYRSTGSLGLHFAKFTDQANAAVLSRQRAMMIYLTDRILELTPVWEGDSIVNWKWSLGAPDTSVIKARGQNIDPGPTGSMALGDEPRRAVNEAVVRESLVETLSALKVPTDVYFTNTSSTILDLEYGLLPTPGRSRSPNGIVRLAIKEATGSLH